jgi:hypothetical protein
LCAVEGQGKELHNLYASEHFYGDQVKEDEMGGSYVTHGEMRNVYKVLVGNLEGNRPLGRPGRRWEDNIKVDIKGSRFKRVWTGFTWLRLGASGGPS